MRAVSERLLPEEGMCWSAQFALRKYADKTGAGGCTACDIDFTSLPGSTSKDDCYRKCLGGEFGRKGDSGRCQPCSEGKYSNASAFECTECSPGSVSSSNSSKCTLCDPGSYQDKFGEATCKTCLPDTYSDSNGAAKCITCPNGYGTNKTAGNSACMNKGLYESCSSGFIKNLTTYHC